LVPRRRAWLEKDENEAHCLLNDQKQKSKLPETKGEDIGTSILLTKKREKKNLGRGKKFKRRLKTSTGPTGGQRMPEAAAFIFSLFRPSF